MSEFQVYSVSYKGLPAYHEAIYVEMSQAGGFLYHVIGDNLSGYRYEKRATNGPERSESFSHKVYKGKVANSDLSTFEAICRDTPPPRHQVIHGVTFEKDCRHWVLDALKKLREAHVLR
ncbi:hypothetical protein AYL99_04977 [Fonsecaea erecta]|uniref:PPPDE domain-containing protein n=1 Tax=Fonsecaea erecta TaxID=1367422 RepID=A0A178ZLS4_9EURO|nr:hypothetical protein AYL99_04977 [Fonsecaea erecta]OAP59975.1 hypothetical protein AYL99_04977 [Fonsecaea erecta]